MGIDEMSRKLVLAQIPYAQAISNSFSAVCLFLACSSSLPFLVPPRVSTCSSPHVSSVYWLEVS